MSNTYFGYTESESLHNPLILNDYKPIKVEIEYVPTSTNHPFVHAYYLKFTEDNITEEVEKFAKETLPEWYQLFWNDQIVYAIFKDKYFKMTNEHEWESEEYKAVQQYGVEHGIDLVYLNFNTNFARFRETLAKRC
jgi:hypothetical protein